MMRESRKAFRGAAFLWLAIATLASSCEACHCDPHRNKPWRRLADPPVEPSPEVAARRVKGQADQAGLAARLARTLRIHMDSEPRHVIPFYQPSVWSVRVAQGTIFESLIRYQPPAGGVAGHGPGSYQPALARSFTRSADGMQIRVELRDDVRFHDGRRMTSADVQFSLDAARDPRYEADHLRARLSDIEKVDRAGPHGILVWLKRPSGWTLRALAEVPILPEHVYVDRRRAVRGPVIGTGPYRLESWADGVIHLRASPDYWGRKPAVTDVEFIHEPDASRAVTAAKRGDVDIIPELIAAHYPAQVSAPGIEGVFVPLRLQPPTFRYLVFDTRRPPFDDVRVRRAVALLVDRAQIAKEVGGGLLRPVAGPVWFGGPGDGPSAAPPPYDPAEGYQLLDAAGWRDVDRDNRRERHRQHLAVDMLMVDKEDPEVATIVTSLRGAGFVVNEREGPGDYLLKLLGAGDFHLALVEWRGVVDDDLAPLLETGGSRNHGRFSSPAVDAALQQLREAWDPATRATRMAALPRALADSWPLAGVVRPDPCGLIHRRVRGAVVWNGWISIPEISLAPGP